MAAMLIEEVDAHVGKRIRERRVEIRMSQTELGGAMGVNYRQIQKYEKGQDRVSAGRLHKAASALGVPVSYFFPEGK